MEFHDTFSYNISGNVMVMHINVCHNCSRCTGVNAL